MTSRLWQLIEAHIDAQRYPPSAAQVARELGYNSRQSIDNLKSLKRLPDVDILRAIARISHFTYREVLDAALVDIGYLEDREVPDARLRQANFDLAAQRRRSRGQEMRRQQDEADPA